MRRFPGGSRACHGQLRSHPRPVSTKQRQCWHARDASQGKSGDSPGEKWMCLCCAFLIVGDGGTWPAAGAQGPHAAVAGGPPQECALHRGAHQVQAGARGHLLLAPEGPPGRFQRPQRGRGGRPRGNGRALPVLPAGNAAPHQQYAGRESQLCRSGALGVSQTDRVTGSLNSLHTQTCGCRLWGAPAGAAVSMARLHQDRQGVVRAELLADVAGVALPRR